MAELQTLDYAPPPPPRQLLRRLVTVGILINMAAGIAVAYWSVTDWGMYLEDWYGPGRDWRKGELPIEWQVLESSFVGLVATAALYGLYLLVRRWLRQASCPGVAT